MQHTVSCLRLELRVCMGSAGVPHQPSCRKWLVCWSVSVLAQQKLPGDLGCGSKQVQRLRSLACIAVTPAPKDGVAGCPGIAGLPVL